MARTRPLRPCESLLAHSTRCRYRPTSRRERVTVRLAATDRPRSETLMRRLSHAGLRMRGWSASPAIALAKSRRLPSPHCDPSSPSNSPACGHQYRRHRKRMARCAAWDAVCDAMLLTAAPRRAAPVEMCPKQATSVTGPNGVCPLAPHDYHPDCAVHCTVPAPPSRPHVSVQSPQLSAQNCAWCVHLSQHSPLTTLQLPARAATPAPAAVSDAVRDRRLLRCIFLGSDKLAQPAAASTRQHARRSLVEKAQHDRTCGVALTAHHGQRPSRIPYLHLDR